MSWKLTTLCLGMFVACFVGGNMQAQQSLDLTGVLTVEQENASMEFVAQHHPELVQLLERLKTMKRDEYDSALREIQKVRKRLEVLEKRDPLMGQVELDGWKIQSQIDLMLARAVVHEKEFDVKSLRQLVEKKIINQRKHLEAEKAALILRQKQIDELIQRNAANEQDRITQQTNFLVKKIDSKKFESKKNDTFKSKGSSNVDTNRGTK